MYEWIDDPASKSSGTPPSAFSDSGNAVQHDARPTILIPPKTPTKAEANLEIRFW